MLLSTLKRPNSGQANAINLAITVKSYEDHATGRAVRGTNMATGKEVMVYLSQKSKDANRSNRRPLAEFESGYNAFGKFYKVVPGGVLTFTSCYQTGENEFSANWCNRLSNDAEGAKSLRFHEVVTVRRFGSAERGNLQMKVVMWKPDKRVEFNNIDALHAKIKQFVDGVNQSIPGGRFEAVVRALNAKGEVTAATLFHTPWHRGDGKTDAGRVMTGEEAVQWNSAQDEGYKAFLAQLAPGQTVEFVPAVSMSLSPLALDASRKNNQIPFYMEISNRFFHEGQIYARHAVLEFAETKDSGRLVANLMVEDPWGQALDPGLMILDDSKTMTERAYSPEMLAAIEAASTGGRNGAEPETQDAGTEAQPAAAAATASHAPARAPAPAARPTPQPAFDPFA